MRYFFSVRYFQIFVQLKSLAIQPNTERFIEGTLIKNYISHSFPFDRYFLMLSSPLSLSTNYISH